jgi:hypothetical protein
MQFVTFLHHYLNIPKGQNYCTMYTHFMALQSCYIQNFNNKYKDSNNRNIQYNPTHL